MPENISAASSGNSIPPFTLKFAVIIILIGVAIYYLAPVLMPFLIAGLLAYLANPLVNKLLNYKFSRLTAVLLVFFSLLLCIALCFLLMVPFLYKQIAMLDEQIPHILNWFQNTARPFLNQYINIDFFNIKNIKSEVTKNMLQAGGAAAWVLHSSKAALELVLNLILIPVVTFYLLRDWDDIWHYFKSNLPVAVRPAAVKLVTQIDYVLSGFFRGTLIVMLFLAIYYSTALSLIGLHLGVAIGIIVGLTSIVPYLGLFIGIALAIIAALVQFGTLFSVFEVALAFLIGHSIENFYLTPTLIGDRIGLHPVLVIFAILAGGTLFGFFGVLLALPVAAVLLVLVKHCMQNFANYK